MTLQLGPPDWRDLSLCPAISSVSLFQNILWKLGEKVMMVSIVDCLSLKNCVMYFVAAFLEYRNWKQMFVHYTEFQHYIFITDVFKFPVWVKCRR